MMRRLRKRILSVEVRKTLVSVCSTVEGILTLADTDSEWGWIQGKWMSRFGILLR